MPYGITVLLATRQSCESRVSFFGWLLNKKVARVEVNISLAFLYWVGIALHP